MIVYGTMIRLLLSLAVLFVFGARSELGPQSDTVANPVAPNGSAVGHWHHVNVDTTGFEAAAAMDVDDQRPASRASASWASPTFGIHAWWAGTTTLINDVATGIAFPLRC
jgi:hypothetical protein